MLPRSCNPSRRRPRTSFSFWGMVSGPGLSSPWGPHSPGTQGCLQTQASPGDSGLTRCVPSGMGVSTVTATRILKGQMNGKLGPETPLAMDQFPYLALSKVRLGAPGWVWDQEPGQKGRAQEGWALRWGLGAARRDLGSGRQPQTELKVSLLPDIQRGQTGARQRRHHYRLPLRGQDQYEGDRGKRGRPL